MIATENNNFAKEFSIIWFYKNSHIALEIDNTFLNPFWRCIETENADTTQRKRTLEGSGQPYYQFHIGLSPEEKEQLLQE